jgi:plasmid replication initiation protein
MADKQLALPSEVVKKSNALMRCRWSVESIWEPRLVALLASKVQKDDKDFQVYEIPVSDIFQNYKGGGKDYKELEKIADSLMSRVITIYDDDGWTKYNVFSPCRFHRSKGVLEIKFHPDLLPHYLQLQKKFAQYNLMEFLLLPSTYSQRLFEIIKSWDDKQEIEISILDLHEMLNVPQSLRKDFRNFRIRVLEKAHKDISECTSLRYEWEPIKKGRAVVAVRFIFAKKRALPVKKKKQDDAKVKQSRTTGEAFTTAIACYQERGNECQGGHQKAAVCSLCRHLYPRLA